MLDWEDSANPYPLDHEEMERLLKALPEHLRVMAIFAANTGLREQGVCWLRWDWEVAVPELDTSIFITPWRKGEYSNGVWPVVIGLGLLGFRWKHVRNCCITLMATLLPIIRLRGVAELLEAVEKIVILKPVSILRRAI